MSKFLGNRLSTVTEQISRTKTYNQKSYTKGRKTKKQVVPIYDLPRGTKTQRDFPDELGLNAINRYNQMFSDNGQKRTVIGRKTIHHNQRIQK